MTAPLLVMALSVEAQGRFEAEGVEVLYTGIGKVNAALNLARRLAELRGSGLRPSLVVNFGTAGSRRWSTGALIECTRFEQRDMDVTGLGFSLGETPFEEVPKTLTFPRSFPHLPEGVCGTADRFDNRSDLLAWDVVDMEAYALAKACWFEGHPFACVKYVSDGADADAAGDWQASLPRAAEAFLRLYRELLDFSAGGRTVSFSRQRGS